MEDLLLTIRITKEDTKSEEPKVKANSDMRIICLKEANVAASAIDDIHLIRFLKISQDVQLSEVVK